MRLLPVRTDSVGGGPARSTRGERDLGPIAAICTVEDTVFATGLSLLGNATTIAQERPMAGPPGMPGSDRDAHGCIASAGYSWCARSQQCERPWELAEKQGFAVTRDAFEWYCGDSE